MGLHNRKRSEWSREANCQDIPNGDYDTLFFPSKGRPRLNPPYMKYCEPCPVARECLLWAVVHEAEGVWGGVTEAQRRALPAKIRRDLLIQAKAEGWFEPDWKDYLNYQIPRQYSLGTSPEFEAFLSVDEFQFDFEKTPQGQEVRNVVSTKVVLSGTIPIPNGAPVALKSHNVFQFDFEVL